MTIIIEEDFSGVRVILCIFCVSVEEKEDKEEKRKWKVEGPPTSSRLQTRLGPSFVKGYSRQ